MRMGVRDREMKARVSKCLLKLNSNVCVVVLKYSEELLPVNPPTEIVFEGLLKNCRTTSLTTEHAHSLCSFLGLMEVKNEP